MNETTLGLFTIVEYDSFVGNRQGKVWECGRDGKPRWQVNNLFGAMDGQLLPNGRILAAEHVANAVRERDRQGKIAWEVKVPNAPIACRRLDSTSESR